MELRHNTHLSSSPSASSHQRCPATGTNIQPIANSGDLLLPRSFTGIVCMRKNNLANLPNICEKLRAIFGVQLQEIFYTADEQHYQQQQFATFQVLVLDEGSGCSGSVASPLTNGDLICQIQQFIDSLCTNEAEDSSYDSDCDGEDLSHEQVSRTTSDTLGQEFAEYVSVSTAAGTHQQGHHGKDVSPTAAVSPTTTSVPEHSPGYQQRVEFALKLGYTEKLVQAALQRLGPNPAQNELLAELIKLGSQPGAKCGSEFTADCHAHHGIGEAGGHGLGTELPTSVSGLGIPSSSSACEESLRPIVIDGSNVAMSHGNKEVFSCRGIRLCVDWFKNRGHKDITVFVPKWRKESSRPDNPVKDGEMLNELEKERMLVFTPSRLVGGKRMVCYDDRYILKLAADNDGIVVSNDNYRDLVQESSEFKKVVEERVLMYSFVNDRFMPPDDPLGRSGPTLENFLRKQPRKGDPPPPCPYGKKCTYGNKCKFYHPERGSLPHKSVTERLSEYAARHLQARNGHDQQAGCTGIGAGGRSAVQRKSLSVPLSNNSNETSPTNDKRKTLCRTRSNVPSDSTSSTYGISHGAVHHSDLIPPVHALPHQVARQQQQQPASSQQMPFHTSPVASNMPLSWDPSAQQQQQQLHQHASMVDVQQIFPKSHSIENVSNEPPYGGGGGHRAGLHHAGCYGGGAQALWPRQQQPSQPPPQQQTVTGASGQGAIGAGAGGSGSVGSSSAGQPAPSLDPSDPSGLVDSVNLHRKLQRQLTLNPAGCDPRIYQMQRLQQQSSQQQSQQQQGASQQPSPHAAVIQQLSPHRPLAPSLSGGARPSAASQWELHQHVTRIASAPDSSRPWGHNGPPPGSSSEPQINLGWSPTASPGGPTPAQQHHHQQQQDRCRLHYHLASIFPEDQVQTVMQMLPDETNPQKICAAILAMYQKM
ncbi:probable ribonuclease ZC3H12C [Anopheles nili]|uniref:probable ribonuclease ZC3H12C n=1 Tax=Anopheles nili TaxID=185578 RepID=UPI00237AF84C|nr:probable ribonuclease ZC3H12C [Anopheles nili]